MITLHDLLAQYEQQKTERRATAHDGLTASAHGTLCAKQTAYGLRRAEPSDETDPVSVSTVGSLIHVGVGELWKEHVGTFGVEAESAIGTADVLDLDGLTTDIPGVRDLKTLSRDKFNRWIAPRKPDPVTGEITDEPTGPPESVWSQLGSYAAALFPAEPADLDRVTRLVVDALCRETGRTHSFVRDVTAEWCRDAADRLSVMQDELSSMDPDDMDPPRDGPDDWLCRGCAWRTRCWGERDREPEDIGDVDLLLAAYWHASQQEKEAKARKKDLARRLAYTGEGVYGSWGLRWGTYSFPERIMPPTSGTYPKPYPIEEQQ